MSWWSITTDGTQCWIQTFRWGGGGGEGSGGHPDPEKMGGEVSKEFFFNFFPPLGPQFGLKIRGGGGGADLPLDLPGTFLAIDPTQTIFHACKWSSLELVIWTQILQLNLYCLDLLFVGLAGLFSGKISAPVAEGDNWRQTVCSKQNGRDREERIEIEVHTSPSQYL